MAGSRLEKIGSVFTRTTGLLRSGAMKIDDKPIWYDVFVAFPPTLEPRYDRPAPNIKLRNIFYEEDNVRAKFHAKNKNLGTINLSDESINTSTQLFLNIYRNLKQQGALDDTKIFDIAEELLNDKLQQSRSSTNDNYNHDSPNLVKSFTDAKNNYESPTVNIKQIFK